MLIFISLSPALSMFTTYRPFLNILKYIMLTLDDGV